MLRDLGLYVAIRYEVNYKIMLSIEQQSYPSALYETETLRPIENRGLALISTVDLENGFREYNRGIAVPEEQQKRIDELLLLQSQEIGSSSLADHGRRVGGYAGALVRRLGGVKYDTNFHEGLVRVMGSLHDIGKVKTDRSTLMRSLGIEGWGTFDRITDMPAMESHPKDGFDIVDNDKILPPETKFIAGCHHQFPADGTEAYGVSLSKIDEAYCDKPAMRDWVHFAVRIIAAADVYDAATSRNNGYFSQDASMYDKISERLIKIIPEHWQTAMTALQDEHMHYYLRAPRDN